MSGNEVTELGNRDVILIGKQKLQTSFYHLLLLDIDFFSSRNIFVYPVKNMMLLLSSKMSS